MKGNFFFKLLLLSNNKREKNKLLTENKVGFEPALLKKKKKFIQTISMTIDSFATNNSSNSLSPWLTFDSSFLYFFFSTGVVTAAKLAVISFDSSRARAQFDVKFQLIIPTNKVIYFHLFFFSRYLDRNYYITLLYLPSYTHTQKQV